MFPFLYLTLFTFNQVPKLSAQEGTLGEFCPLLCDCGLDIDSEWGEGASCHGWGFLDTPEDLPTQARWLELIGFTMGGIRSGELRSFRNLRYLSLKDSAISVIQKRGFYGLTRLKVLDLTRNFLVNIDEILGDVRSLEVLHLQYNRLRNVETAFHKTTNMTWLNLVELSKLKNFSDILNQVGSLSGTCHRQSSMYPKYNACILQLTNSLIICSRTYRKVTLFSCLFSKLTTGVFWYVIFQP